MKSTGLHCLCEGALICAMRRFVSEKTNTAHILSVMGALLGTPLELTVESSAYVCAFRKSSKPTRMTLNTSISMDMETSASLNIFVQTIGFSTYSKLNRFRFCQNELEFRTS